MARIVVMGAGLGGMSAAYELRETLGKGHEIVLVGNGDSFGFTPSNPWLAVGWRKRDEISLDVAEHVGRHGIRFDGNPNPTRCPVRGKERPLLRPLSFLG